MYFFLNAIERCETKKKKKRNVRYAGRDSPRLRVIIWYENEMEGVGVLSIHGDGLADSFVIAWEFLEYEKCFN